MTTREALAYLQKRIQLMNSRYVASWPRWTVADHVAAQIVVREAIQELARHTQNDETDDQIAAITKWVQP